MQVITFYSNAVVWLESAPQYLRVSYSTRTFPKKDKYLMQCYYVDKSTSLAPPQLLPEIPKTLAPRLPLSLAARIGVIYVGQLLSEAEALSTALDLTQSPPRISIAFARHWSPAMSLLLWANRDTTVAHLCKASRNNSFYYPFPG
jgi:hypothetical protein